MPPKKSKEIRVRIAPSPTGPLHLGTARSALFNYLFAQKNQGKFILRIEDTDLERSEKRWEKDIIQNLKWLGLEHDEGPGTKGEYGPYRQSARLTTYRQYLQKLLKAKKAYYCYCTEKELSEERNLQRTKGEPPRYLGKCLNLAAAQIKKYKKEGRKPVIRFKVPGKRIQFQDIIRGDLDFDATLMGDPIIAKDLDIPLYNFAVVVDDYLMKISHVIRGEDHLTNTPKQIAMQEALGFPRPQYAHLPLILNPDRSKMSKRKMQSGGVVVPVRIKGFREEGYLPKALVNYLALLGWSPKDNQETFTLAELIKRFSLKKVNKSGAVFNLNKLENINASYIRKLPLKKLVALILEQNFLRYDLQNFSSEYIEKAIATIQGRLKKLSQAQEFTRFYFEKPDYHASLLIWQDSSPAKIKENLEQIAALLNKTRPDDFREKKLAVILKKVIAKLKIGAGEMLWPLRVALTGLQGSPSPFEVAAVLGKDETIKRVNQAMRKL